MARVYTNSSQQTIKPSPRLNIILFAFSNWQLYLKSGMGFHTNDPRVVNAQNGKKILPSAYGADIGTIIKPTQNLYMNVAGWYLFLEQEFVYVGDEAVVEPSGQTLRLGVDLSIRYQPLKWLFIHADVNYAFARAVGTPTEESHIPLSAAFTSVGGLSMDFPIGIQGGLNYR
ncbi:MAG: outer membrane receptor for Fe3+-dicitrate [Flavobacteriales bacterium]|jgi:outer membrane receptor for Fe3+-dicitrate